MAAGATRGSSRATVSVKEEGVQEAWCHFLRGLLRSLAVGNRAHHRRLRLDGSTSTIEELSSLSVRHDASIFLLFCGTEVVGHVAHDNTRGVSILTVMVGQIGMGVVIPIQWRRVGSTGSSPVARVFSFRSYCLVSSPSLRGHVLRALRTWNMEHHFVKSWYQWGTPIFRMFQS